MGSGFILWKNNQVRPCISNHIHGSLGDAITHPCLNYNFTMPKLQRKFCWTTFEVGKCTSDYIPMFCVELSQFPYPKLTAGLANLCFLEGYYGISQHATYQLLTRIVPSVDDMWYTLHKCFWKEGFVLVKWSNVDQRVGNRMKDISGFIENIVTLS